MLSCPPVDTSGGSTLVLFGDHQGLSVLPAPLLQAVGTRLADRRNGVYVVPATSINRIAPGCRISIESLTLVSTSPEVALKASPIGGAGAPRMVSEKSLAFGSQAAQLR